MAKLREVELRIVSLPMHEAFASAHGSTATKRALLVRVETDAGFGWGECGALEMPTYTSEYVDGAWSMLHDIIGPASLDGVDPAIVGHPMAAAAMEAALVDADLRSQGLTLAEHVGATNDSVVVGVALGLHDTADALVRSVRMQVAAGYQRIKVKVTPASDHRDLEVVRAKFPNIELWADANGSYHDQPVARVAELDRYDLGLIEQPFGPTQLADHAALRRVSTTPICLDETITGGDMLDLAIAAEALDIVNVKPARVGGYAETLRIHSRCQELELGLWLGGMLETGIGRAANLALAGLPGMTHPPDLSASDRYFPHDLVTNPAVMVDGRVDVPDRAEIDEPAVDAATIRQSIVRSSR